MALGQGSFSLHDCTTLPRELLKVPQYRTIFPQQCYLNKGFDLPGKAETVVIINQNERKTLPWKSETQNGNPMSRISRHLI